MEDEHISLAAPSPGIDGQTWHWHFSGLFPDQLAETLPGSRLQKKDRRLLLQSLALPSLLESCKLGEGITTITGGGQGNPLVFDFNKGDTAFLQFTYCYKQLQADMYAQAMAK